MTARENDIQLTRLPSKWPYPVRAKPFFRAAFPKARTRQDLRKALDKFESTSTWAYMPVSLQREIGSLLNDPTSPTS